MRVFALYVSFQIWKAATEKDYLELGRWVMVARRRWPVTHQSNELSLAARLIERRPKVNCSKIPLLYNTEAGSVWNYHSSHLQIE